MDSSKGILNRAVIGWTTIGHSKACNEPVALPPSLPPASRSRTFNLLQTLEPLATKARRALGLPAMVVENRDEATLEASARVYEPRHGLGYFFPPTIVSLPDGAA